MQRTSVDLPLPESPMTTKISPRRTSKEMSRGATVQPHFAISSAGEIDVAALDRPRRVRPEDLPDVAAGDLNLRGHHGFTTRWLGAMGECEARTQVAFVALATDATEDAASHRPALPDGPFGPW